MGGYPGFNIGGYLYTELVSNYYFRAREKVYKSILNMLVSFSILKYHLVTLTVSRGLMSNILNCIEKISAEAAKAAATGQDADTVLKLAEATVQLTKSWATIKDFQMHAKFHEDEENYVPGGEPLVNVGH